MMNLEKINVGGAEYGLSVRKEIKNSLLKLCKSVAYTQQEDGQIVYRNMAKALDGVTGDCYIIENELSNVSNSNSRVTLEIDSSYIATLKAESGYLLDTVVITMGGEDITSTVYSDGTIRIENVTADVVIYAVANKLNVVDATWESGGFGNSGVDSELQQYTAKKTHRTPLSEIIPVTVGQTVTLYNTNPEWSNEYDGTALTACMLYTKLDNGEIQYIYPWLTFNERSSMISFYVDPDVNNYQKAIGCRLLSYNMEDYIDTAVVAVSG